jgi:hypothetical protein
MGWGVDKSGLEGSVGGFSLGCKRMEVGILVLSRDR